MSTVIRLLFSALGKVPAWVWLALLLVAWGWNNARQATAARADLQEHKQAQLVQALQESETARAVELAMTSKNREISDALYNARTQRDAAARTAADRLRQLAQEREHSATTEAALAACRAYEGAPVRVIPDSTREALVELAKDADEVSDRLRACQAYVSAMP